MWPDFLLCRNDCLTEWPHVEDRESQLVCLQIPGRIQRLPDQRPLSSNSLTGGEEEGRDCDYYTDTLCLGVRDYPRQEISRLLGANRRLSHDMIADVTAQSADDLIDGVSSSKMIIDILIGGLSSVHSYWSRES